MCSQASPSIVRNPEGSIYLYTKGADTVIFDRLYKKSLTEWTTEEALAVSPSGKGERIDWRGREAGEKSVQRNGLRYPGRLCTVDQAVYHTKSCSLTHTGEEELTSKLYLS